MSSAVCSRLIQLEMLASNKISAQCKKWRSLNWGGAFSYSNFIMLSSWLERRSSVCRFVTFILFYFGWWTCINDWNSVPSSRNFRSHYEENVTKIVRKCKYYSRLWLWASLSRGCRNILVNAFMKHLGQPIVMHRSLLDTKQPPVS